MGRPAVPSALSSSSRASRLSALPSVLQPVRDRRPFGDTLAPVNRSSSACLPEPITLKRSSAAAQGFTDVQMICSGSFSSTSPPTQQLLPQFT